jgi:hypothetical protein
MDLSKFDVQQLSRSFMNSTPFNHLIIDNFFDESYLNDILSEINNYTHDIWYDKQNASINNEPDSIVQSKKIALTDYNKITRFHL